ncbi:hypothetical protein EJB05_25264, partial [Eragrostis curvula]
MGKRRAASQAATPSSRDAKIARAADRTRDWADLEDGPAGLVAERVLADDVAGYIFFHAVCRSWRRCCDDPRTRGGGVLEDPRLRPRQWIMLVGEKEKLDAFGAPHRSLRQFLNVSTGKCIQVEVPELLDHGVIPSTAADGLLFLHCKATGAVRLLNPLTRQKAELPPVSTRPTSLYTSCNAGLADDRTALLNLSSVVMAFAKPGDERWSVLENNTRRLMPNVFFAGCFYGISDHAIMTVDMTRGDEQPRVVVAAKLGLRFRGLGMDETAHLVDNGGKLMLVHRTTRDSTSYKRMYQVYKVDLKAGRVTTRGIVGLSLGGHAVFVAKWHALSVSPRVFPSINANTIYLGLSLTERVGLEQIGAYRIRDGTTESFSYDTQNASPHPWSVADCLAAYVSACL